MLSGHKSTAASDVPRSEASFAASFSFRCPSFLSGERGPDNEVSKAAPLAAGSDESDEEICCWIWIALPAKDCNEIYDMP
jgi:hypothetical protein